MTFLSAKRILVMLPVVMLIACTKHQIVPLTAAQNLVISYGKVDAHICTSAPSPAQQNLKYLYILDHSASNQPGFPNALTPTDVTNTDSGGSRRYGPLVNFTQTLAPVPGTSTSFGLIDFNDTATQPGTLDGFDADVNDFINNVTTDWTGGGTPSAPAPYDHGFTNYQAALQLAYTMIQMDAQNQASNPVQPIVTTSYVIIFVSDGIPVIATPSGSTPTYTQTYNDDIGPVINSILNLKNDPSLGPLISNITLNTAYYDNGVEVPAAETLLAQMASAGNGQYLKFDAGQNVLYQQFTPPSRNLANQLLDVFVQNTNAVWDASGNFQADSDGDGLPDLIERRYGSDPLKKDSDGNGVSDLVEYRTKGKPCNDAQCLASGRDTYAICSGFSPVTGPDGSVTFSSSSNDGLNDCEKYLLGANRSVYNSNGDLIPDQYAFTSFLPIIAGSSAKAFADPFADGIDNYSKLKLGLPLGVSMTTLLNFTPRHTVLVEEASPLTDVSCYHLTVDHIALASYTDTIKLMVVQNTAAFQDKPFLMSATAPVTGDGRTAVFSSGDFH